MADLRCMFDWQLQDRGWIPAMNLTIHTSDNLFCSNSFPILELSVKFASQICHENSNKLLDGAYLSDFGIDITARYNQNQVAILLSWKFIKKIQFTLYFAGKHHINAKLQKRVKYQTTSFIRVYSYLPNLRWGPFIDNWI